MKRFIFVSVLLLLLFILAACGGAPAAPAASVVGAPQSIAPEEPAPESQAPEALTAGAKETVVDEQGAIVVSVTPLTLDQNAATLDFEVALNTHSVDLSMDLSELALLTTDTGVAVAASNWNAPQGGHHVSGVLSFPADADGASLLEGATRITLTLEDVDVPARTFVWDLN